jgi:predicted alpha/beta-hydrolase family hydrolase
MAVDSIRPLKAGYRAPIARTLKISTPHGPVAGKLEVPKNSGSFAILLAHGAGAGQDHPWMVAARKGLAGRGFIVLTFNYAYTEEGRKAPDRLPKLIDVHGAAANRLASYSENVVLAGKSMGGRVGGHVAAESGFNAAGLVFFGYPIVAIGKTEPRDTSHLRLLDIPQLFVSGSRDPMGPSNLIGAAATSVPDGRYIPIEAGDHSLVPLKRSGRTLEDSMTTAFDAVDETFPR